MVTIYSDLQFEQARGDGGVRGTTQMVVIHATDNTATAAGEAAYAAVRSDLTSAHFYSDEQQVIQALPTDHEAYGCYPTGNSRSIQFELCGLSNHLTDATLRRVAPIVARVCSDWAIPIRHIGPSELVAGAKGICGHADVTLAWGQGDHTDPGSAFPWSTFIGYVQAALNPAPTTTGDDMPQDSGELAPGFAFDQDGNWLDETKALIVPVPQVGPKSSGEWGPAWLYVASPEDAVVRHATLISGAYHDWADAHPGLFAAAGPIGLGDGTTAVLLGRKKASATDTADSVPVRWRVQYG